MKIAYVLYGRFPTERAHGIQVAKVCEALGKEAETTLVVPDFIASRGIDPFATYGIERTFEVVRLPARGPHANPVRFFIGKLSFLLRAARYVRRQGSELIISREALFTLFSPAPTVLEVHDLPRRRAPYVPLWNRSRMVVAKTEALRRELIVTGVESTRIAVLPNAVDLKDFAAPSDTVGTRQHYALPTQSPIALYVGSLQSWKGVSTFLAAAAKVSNAVFAVAGGTDTERKALAKAYPATNIRFLGAIPHAAVPALLKSADMLVLPNSKRAQVSERYTSPLKLFEYMAARRPIIASRLASIEEILAPTEGFYFEPDNPEDLARALREALTNPSDAAARSEAAFARVSGNTWEAYAQRLRMAGSP